MNTLSYQEALQVLRRAGFREEEIARFYRLRQTYLTSELDQPPLDPCRLQFARWLVNTGRLTEELPTEKMTNEPPAHQRQFYRWIQRILSAILEYVF